MVKNPDSKKEEHKSPQKGKENPKEKEEKKSIQQASSVTNPAEITSITNVPPIIAEAQKEAEKQLKKDELVTDGVVKDIEKAILTIRFYPVAADIKSKEEAFERIISAYSSGNEMTRQLILYLIHEQLSYSIELRTMHNFEYFKARQPNAEPCQLRLNVYHSMFNYNTSIEGLIEFIHLLGKLEGNEDSSKVLTSHFTHLATYESETNQMLRAAILETLGESKSLYAFRTLLAYARYCDNERTFHRIVNALFKWEEKIDGLKISDKEKENLKSELKEVVSSEFAENHYG